MSSIKNILLVLSSIFLAIGLLEFFLLFSQEGIQVTKGAEDLVKYDEKMGWVPKPDAHATDRYGNDVTILPDGTRFNDNQNFSAEPPILVVGDSFVFGEEVDNKQSWPSQIEKLLGKKVMNAGVNGYGIDQSFLRAEELMEKYSPSLLVFGFFTDDIARCSLSRRFKNKPYFEMSKNDVVLRNVPVPKDSLFETVFGKSLLANKVSPDLSIRVAHDEYEQVSALLLLKISNIAKSKKIPIIFVVQYNQLTRDKKEQVDRVLFYVNEDGYGKVIDFYNPLKKIFAESTANIDRFFYSFNYNGRKMLGHMSADGNKYVARYIVDNCELKSTTVEALSARK